MDVNSDIDSLSDEERSCFEISGVDWSDDSKSSESELQPAGKTSTNKNNKKISGVDSNERSKSSQKELELQPAGKNTSIVRKGKDKGRTRPRRSQTQLRGSRSRSCSRSRSRTTIRWDRSRLSPETVQAVETFKSWSKDFDLENSFQK